MQEKLAQYYYNLGAELAMQHSGLEKTAFLKGFGRVLSHGTPSDLVGYFGKSDLPSTISRLRPLGGKSITAGIGYTGLGTGLGVGAGAATTTFR